MEEVEEDEDFEFPLEEPREEEAVVLDDDLPDINVPLHSLFVDFSLEDELKGEELEWFKSRVFLRDKPKEEKAQKSDLGGRKVEVITAAAADSIRRKEKPGKLYLKLSETNTMWLLTVQPAVSEDNEMDAEKVRRQNATYEMKKTKKELIRKRCMAVTQTPKILERSLGTLTAPMVKRNAEAFASEWDLYDIYTALDKDDNVTNTKFIDLTVPRDKKQQSKESDIFLPQLNQEKVLEGSNLKYASLVMERLVASNCYQDVQNVFKKKSITRYDEDPTTFSYTIEPLWYFKKDSKRVLMVTDLDWNPLYEDLLAVGYGNLDFSKAEKGFVCIWSPKNPRQPEREFRTDDTVVSLSYSKVRPNVLAVGTRDGKVYVVDVSSPDGYQRILGGDNSVFLPGPIWKIRWFQHQHLTIETEKLLAVGESGILMLFSFSREQKKSDILKLDYVTSTTKLSSSKRLQDDSETLVYEKKTFSGLYFSLFSDRKFCYISTKEGVVIKCNLRNPSMMDHKFLAHDGPAYTVEHSPVTDLVFLTCGADWNIHIWMEEIDKPVVTLQNKAPVRCAKWSPTIPTIIGSVSDDELSIWDISRNVLEPMSRKTLGIAGKLLTTLLFSSNGQNIMVGSEDGLVHVVHLSQLPKIPFLQKEALIGGIKKGLERRKELMSIFLRVTEKYRDNVTTNILEEIHKLPVDQ